MKVKDLVAKEIVTVDAEAPIHEIAVKMKERNVGMVPVLSNGIPVGVVTDRDLVLRVLAPITEPHIMTAWDVMTREPACIDEDATLEDAAEMMRKRAVRRLIVTTHEGTPEAVVSATDLSRILRAQPKPPTLLQV